MDVILIKPCFYSIRSIILNANPCRYFVACDIIQVRRDSYLLLSLAFWMGHKGLKYFVSQVIQLYETDVQVLE